MKFFPFEGVIYRVNMNIIQKLFMSVHILAPAAIILSTTVLCGFSGPATDFSLTNPMIWSACRFSILWTSLDPWLASTMLILWISRGSRISQYGIDSVDQPKITERFVWRRSGWPATDHRSVKCQFWGQIWTTSDSNAWTFWPNRDVKAFYW